MNYLKEKKEHVGKGRLRSPYGASHILQLKETRPTKCLKAMNDLATKFGSHTLLKEDPRNCEIRMFTVGVGYESKVKHYCSLCTLNNTSFNNSEAALVFYRIDIDFCAWGMLQMLNFRTPRMAFSPGLPFGGLELGSGADAKGSNGVVTASPATRLCGYFCRGRPPEITLSAILGAKANGQWCVIHRFILDNLSIKY